MFYISNNNIKCIFCRDDLYRVELDNMGGDEMFYSKVRTDTKESSANNNNNLTMNGVLSSRNGHGSPTRMTFEYVGWKANMRYEMLPQICQHLHHHINQTRSYKTHLLHLLRACLHKYYLHTMLYRCYWGQKKPLVPEGSTPVFPSCIVLFIFKHVLYSKENQRNDSEGIVNDVLRSEGNVIISTGDFMGRLSSWQSVLPDNKNFILQGSLWLDPFWVEHVKKEGRGDNGKHYRAKWAE